jgi:hypothetical protein
VTEVTPAALRDRANAGAAVADERPAASTGARVLRWTIGIAIAVFLLAGVGIWNAHRRAHRAFEEHLARARREQTELQARARGRPALLEPAVEGDAARVTETFLAAVAAVPQADRDRLQSRVRPPSPDEIDRILATYAAPIADFERVLHVPCAVRLGRLDDLGAAESPPYIAYFDALRWLSAANRRAAALDDRARTLRGVALAVTLAGDYERRRALLNRLLGLQIAASAMAPLRDALAGGRIDARDARALARVIDGIDAARPPLAHVADAERTTLRFAYATRSVEFLGGDQPGWRHLWSSTLARGAVLSTLDPDFDRVGDLLSRAEPIDRVALAAACESGTDDDMPHYLVAYPHLVDLESRHLSNRRVARVALAVAAHVAEKGAAPASLDDLVPAYLDRVPTDPWDGEPLRYAAGTPVRVWSVGRDGKDDGGVPFPDLDAHWGTGDVAWSVWAGK